MTSKTGEPPIVLRLLQEWSLPLLVILVPLSVGGEVWLYRTERSLSMERTPPLKRTWTETRPPYPGL
ncbi:MAG: hypothetical protein ACRDYX_15975 [Egibacteraceae bacterium]